MKDPIAPPKNKEMRNPWTFTQPHYDERSSCYVDAGSHYGVGHRQPVGHTGNPKQTVPTLPMGRPPTQEVDEAPRKMLKCEMVK